MQNLSFNAVIEFYFYGFVIWCMDVCTLKTRNTFVVVSADIKSVSYRAFSHDVTAAILVFQNNKTAAMLVTQTTPVGVKLFSYANAFFCSKTFA